MPRQRGFRQRLADWSSVQTVRALALVLVVSIAGLGYLTQRYRLDGAPAIGAILADFYVTVVIAMASVALALLVIDSLNQRSAEEQVKAKLIRELGSTDNGIALRAVRELRARGWLEDGSLRGANLVGANLRRAYLIGGNLQEVCLFRADLQEADLVGTNLQAARLRRANLREARLSYSDLRGAYLARANLAEADLQGAKLQGAKLQGVDLRGARLQGADLTGALLPFADLTGALLQETNLQEAILEGATMPDGSKHE